MSKHLQVNNKVRGKLGQKDNDTRNKGKKRKKKKQISINHLQFADSDRGCRAHRAEGKYQSNRIDAGKKRWICSSRVYVRRRPGLASLFTCRHAFDLITQTTPVLRLQLGIFHPLLAPVLVQPTDVILALLEVKKLVANTLLDKYSTGMLLHDRLLVLHSH